MTYTLSYGVGRVQAAEGDMIWLPRYPRGATKYPVVLCHGASTPQMFAAASWPNLSKLAASLARAGIPCIAPSDAIDRYANDTEMSRIGACAAALNTLLGTYGFACSTSKINLVGASMGSGAAARYAALNPTLVSSVNGLLPMINPVRIYRTNPGGVDFRTPMASAFGLNAPKTTSATCSWGSGSPNVTIVSGQIVTGDAGREIYHADFPLGTTVVSASGTAAVFSQNSTAGHSSQAVSVFDPVPTSSPNYDIFSMAATLLANSTPNRFFYSTIDPYITPSSDVTTFATNSGGIAVAIDSTSAHTDGTAGEWATYGTGGGEFSELVQYLKAHGS